MYLAVGEFWNDARREALRGAVLRGETFGQIAAALGCARNQAAAEARRLELDTCPRAPEAMTARGRRITERRVRAERKPPPAGQRAARGDGAAPSVAAAPRPTGAAKAKPAKEKRPDVPTLTVAEIRSRVGAVEGSRPKPWTARGRGECAWPVEGDGADVRSCCGPCTAGRRYCDPHFAVMYQRRPKVERVVGASERRFR